MSEWQPIETAPRDWSDVLVYALERDNPEIFGVFSAFYDLDYDAWITYASDGDKSLNPTHWMSLPPAPEKTA